MVKKWKERYLTDKSDTWIGVAKTNQFIKWMGARRYLFLSSG